MHRLEERLPVNMKLCIQEVNATNKQYLIGPLIILNEMLIGPKCENN